MPPKKVTQMDMEDFKEMLRGFVPENRIEKAPRSWVLPNRVKFVKWIQSNFQYNDTKQGMFHSQRFIKDYIQYESPYRGILLYHGLGLGKTCASIIAAENLVENGMEVCVFLPASLKNNFINEIKNVCGNTFFRTDQNWTKIPLLKINKIYKEKELKQVIFVEPKLIQKQKGVWIPTKNNGPNFENLNSTQQEEIRNQLHNMIQNKYSLYSYNGLTHNALDKIEKEAGGQNPFDNKMIIIDEVHNFVSRVMGGGMQSTTGEKKKRVSERLYDLLVHAKNAKLILLSGTPIINYPVEISYIINLILGHHTLYTIKPKGKIDEKILDKLEQHPYVDYAKPSGEKGTISLKLVPEGFVFPKATEVNVVRDTEKKDANTIIKDVCKEIGCANPATHKNLYVMPLDAEKFNDKFIDFANNDVKNQRLLARRLMGCVSYFSTKDPELYPRVNKEHLVVLTMSERQYNKYEEKRSEEIKQESKMKTKPTKQNIFDNGANKGTFKVFSRLLCNFVFPEGIDRPYLKDLKVLKKEITIIDDDESEDVIEDESEDVSKKATSGKSKEKSELYKKELSKALRKLVNSAQTHLSLENGSLEQHSPKFAAIIPRVRECKGKCLVYSQFRTVEGLGVFGMALDVNGWAEMNLNKGESGEWEIDINEEDKDKPKYFKFIGGDERIEILLNIFNNNFDAVPESVKRGLGKKHLDNKRGELLKLILITQSGAEGISLKHVRQVHIMEPYWHEIRIQQVIGRAVRANSHADLEDNERQVDIYRYICMISPSQTKKSKLKKDKVIVGKISNIETTDQFIYNVATRKHKIVTAIQDVIKISSVNCRIHSKHHNNAIKCLKFPENISENELSYQIDLEKDEVDFEFKQKVKTRTTKRVFKKCSINGQQYAYEPETKTFYNLALYLEGTLVEEGKLKTVEGNSGSKLVFMKTRQD